MFNYMQNTYNIYVYNIIRIPIPSYVASWGNTAKAKLLPRWVFSVLSSSKKRLLKSSGTSVRLSLAKQVDLFNMT